MHMGSCWAPGQKKRSTGGACLWGLRARPSGRGRAAGGRTGGSARREKTVGKGQLGHPGLRPAAQAQRKRLSPRKRKEKEKPPLFLGIFQRLKKKNKQAQSNSNNFQANANAHDVALWFILCYLAQNF